MSTSGSPTKPYFKQLKSKHTREIWVVKTGNDLILEKAKKTATPTNQIVMKEVEKESVVQK
ncbi:hypothetical protein FQN50_009566 [Emmonsiellopsis sp. PD_5]|nr:hypothetical protein FQN50_009566 [Emmonsiellopsis sp. PD_5]